MYLWLERLLYTLVFQLKASVSLSQIWYQGNSEILFGVGRKRLDQEAGED